MLPNLVIIGAQKSGTTSLYHYLGHHPEIHMSPEKELRFFVAEGNWERGLAWYESHFDRDASVRGEASPQYTHHPQFEGIPERMASVIGGTKLIYIVRDPIERIQADYTHYRAKHERRSIDECVAEPKASLYVQRSRYATQLALFDRCFAPDQILVVDQHDLLVRREDQMRDVHTFLGVEPHFSSPAYALLHNRRHGVGLQRPAGRAAFAALRAAVGHDRAHGVHGYLLDRWEGYMRRPAPQPELSPRRRAELVAVLSDEVSALRERTGKAFASWSL